jgi:LmbE family N-acetylglucosaminyl deacetylase
LQQGESMAQSSSLPRVRFRVFQNTRRNLPASWNRDSIHDVVWVIRNFRPDIIITRFPTTGEGGDGHHTASAILAVDAFKAAADPKRFLTN